MRMTSCELCSRQFFCFPSKCSDNSLYIYSTMRTYNFYTYILTNSTKKVLYAGVTNDLDRRLYEHYFGINQKDSFTSKYKCYYLVWYERHQYINHAIER